MSDGPKNKAIADFAAEAEEIIDQLNTELADLCDMIESQAINPELLNSIFRGAHSLKGLAGMFGFTRIAEVAHNMENLLDSLRMGKTTPDSVVMNVLSESIDLLSTLVRSLAEGDASDNSTDIEEQISRINACLTGNRVDSKVSPIASLGLSDTILSSLTEYEEHRLKDNLEKGKSIYCIHTSFDLITFDTDLESLTSAIKPHGEVISTLPSAGAQLETHIDFDILFGTPLSFDELSGIVSGKAEQIVKLGSKNATEVPKTSVHSEAAEPVMKAGEPQPESPTDADLPAPRETAAIQQQSDDTGSVKSISRTVRVDIGKLDELMNVVGELVLAHTSIAAISNRMRAEGFSRMAIDLGKAAKVLERKLGDLQKGVMDIRMIPVGQLYEKMSRIVRKISREQGKKVDLKLFGADTELDKLIVEDLSDPMMHIIRNAIDHGIETPEQRRACGKDEKGTIRISSYQKGNHVVIEVVDDGAGIDTEKLKTKALQKGLVHDVSSLNHKEALDLIFLPGFSTAEKVTDVSGRGVGMDVVRNNISAISGMVDIDTQKGEGTSFTITLPITLAIIKALIISCAGRTFAISITSVLETLLINPEDILTVERKEVMQLRDITLPLLRLDRFFELSATSQPDAEMYVVVVGVAEKRLGLLVGDLLGQQDIVIKSLGDAFRRFRGISGAADLGDQRTILVLDIGGIINETMRSPS